MRSLVRARPSVVLPGLVGTARTARRAGELLPRLAPGDIAVIDQVDLDRATAQALVGAGVAAVVNTEPMVSGRFPNQGPQVLLDAGVVVVDSAGAAALAGVRDGRQVRLDGDRLLDAGSSAGSSAGTGDGAERILARGRVVDQQTLAEDLERARSGMAAQLETLTHTTGELLRREDGLLLHRRGLPRLTTPVEGRPAVVVTGGPESAAQLAGLAAYLREQRPVLVAVGAGLDVVAAAGLQADVVVLDAADVAHGDGGLPPAERLRRAHDVVVRGERGATQAVLERLERIGVRGSRLETSLLPEDAALLLADGAGATLVVGVGDTGDLTALLDRRRAGLAGTHLVRLRLGGRLVDATAVSRLYSGRVRPWHLLAVMVLGLVALAAAVAVTPVGHDWFTTTVPRLAGQLADQAHRWLADVG